VLFVKYPAKEFFKFFCLKAFGFNIARPF